MPFLLVEKCKTPFLSSAKQVTTLFLIKTSLFFQPSLLKKLKIDHPPTQIVPDLSQNIVFKLLSLLSE